MSACAPERVEAYLLDELDPDGAEHVAAHLGQCARCAREAELLRSERAALVARARVEPLELPAFHQVLLASRAPVPQPRPTRMPTWIAAGLSAAAAVVLMVASARPLPEASGGACYSDGPTNVELAQAGEESHFNECLLASPAGHCN
ncbi:MAG: zf-HC2 domain-containing protein [Deltaproteobacteria bacterium]|nr:zf-HC2 domain-containing protein [Deltaproteobacteria bacterium]